MFNKEIQLRKKNVLFEIATYPNNESAFAYIAAKRRISDIHNHPPFCVELELFRESSGLANRGIATNGEIVSLRTVEVWNCAEINGAMIAELIIEILKRPKKEEQDKAFDPKHLTDFLVRCYEQHDLRVFRITHSSIILKPLSSSITPEVGMEVARFNRLAFGPASSRRSLKTFVQGFVESGIVVVGYD